MLGCRKKIKKLPKRHIENVAIQSKLTSLEARGFMRNIVPYKPPEDGAEKMGKYFEEICGTTNLNEELKGDKKFQLLVALSNEFSYKVPNSILHTMKKLGNVFDFYMTPVDTRVPYDKLQEMDLPPNLHVIPNYHRFHPDEDTKFGGITAFPKSSTIISGLLTKKKYKGFNAGNPWTDI